MIVKGTIVGIPLYGDCTVEEFNNIKELAENILKVQKSLEKVFDKQIADVKTRELRDSSISILDGKVDPVIEMMLQTMCSNGVLRTSRKELTSINMKRRIMIE